MGGGVVITDRVWVSLREDGVEIERVEVPCVEASRRNGIVTFSILQLPRFVDLPCDIGSATACLHEGPNLPPFGSFDVSGYAMEGDNLEVRIAEFTVPVEVPRYQRPQETKRRRLTLRH